MDGCVLGGRSAGFSRIVLLIEACDSGSMLDGMRLPEGVYAVTATRPGENSCEMMVALSRSVAPSISLALKACTTADPIYCCSFFRPPSCTIAGRDISSCLGDIFATVRVH